MKIDHFLTTLRVFFKLGQILFFFSYEIKLIVEVDEVHNIALFLLLLPFQLLLLSHHPVGNILLLHFMKQKWKTTFLFHTSAELLPEYPPLVFLPGNTKAKWIHATKKIL